MTIAQMMYFSMVCQTGNITRAAEMLHIAQPSVTAAIKSLENELGVSLLHRGKRLVTPTPDGERFLDRCNHILGELRDLRTEFDDLKESHDTITIGIPPMIGSFLFPLIFKNFTSKNPDIHIRLREAGSENARELVQNGELDLAIITMGDVPPARLNSEVLVQSRLLYCVGKEHPLAERDHIAFRETANDPLILFSQGYYHRTLLERRFAAEGIEPHILFHSNQILTICGFIRDNIACGFLMPEVLQNFTDIKPLEIQDPLRLNVAVVWRKDDYVTLEAERFIRFCRRTYEHKKL